MWQKHAPVGFRFVANHGEHVGQYMVGLLDAAVGTGVVGADVDLADANAVVDDVLQLGGKIVVLCRRGASPGTPRDGRTR